MISKDIFDNTFSENRSHFSKNLILCPIIKKMAFLSGEKIILGI
jgi:hypothetical protein